MGNGETTGQAKGKGAHPWVQPIIVAKYGTHEETVRLGTLASAQVGLLTGHRAQDEAAFSAWLSGPFTKSVRRASYEQMMKVIEWCRVNGVQYADAAEHDSAAIALPPMRYEDLPKAIARLQVSGTDLRREGSDFAPQGEGKVEVAVLESLTTGKATAQAAHAVWKWMLTETKDKVRAACSASDGLLEASALDMAFEGAPVLRTLAERRPDLAVWDNGLTEIAPQTLTAVATNYL